MREKLMEQIRGYTPCNGQEEADKQLFLHWLEQDTDWNLPKREVYRADPQEVPNMELPFLSPHEVKMHDFV